MTSLFSLPLSWCTEMNEICSSILTLIEKHKMIAEGAGAVSVAAAMFGKVPLKGKKVCCLVSGVRILLLRGAAT